MIEQYDYYSRLQGSAPILPTAGTDAGTTVLNVEESDAEYRA